MIDEIYNKNVLRLAANISRTEPPHSPVVRVSLRSPLCGSTIEVGFCTQKGRISEFCQTIRACALGQASASVMATNIIGKNAKDIQSVRNNLEAVLKEDGPSPEGIWEALSALSPAKEAKPRHGAILLPFDAVLKGLKDLKTGD